jgi:1-acyl-sn-glycerol-3-phosphate acyltransferase
VAVNHLSFFDAPLLYSLSKGVHFAGWAAEKYERHPVFGSLLRVGGAIFIRRGEVDRRALAAAVEALRQGRVFGLAPEGTRSPTGSLIRGRSGVAYLAYTANVPVIPAAVTGTERARDDWRRLRRANFTFTIGKPFQLPRLGHEPRPEDLRLATEEVMCQIGALLPAPYRGEYADHPRLRQLLSSRDSPG